MDFWTTCKVLLRRWYVTLPVFLSALVVAGLVFLGVPATYESTGTVVLTSPAGGATVVEGPQATRERNNPLLVFDGGLMVTSQIIVQHLSSSAFAEQIAPMGGTAIIEAGNGGLDGPFVVVIATGDSAESAQRTVELAMRVSQDDLVERQRRLGAPESTYIGVEEVVAPSAATTLIGGRTRFAVVALGLGFFAALLSAYMIESYLVARRRKRTGDALDGGPETGAAPTSTPPPPRPAVAPVPVLPSIDPAMALVSTGTGGVDATRPMASRPGSAPTPRPRPRPRPTAVPGLTPAAVNGRSVPEHRP